MRVTAPIGLSDYANTSERASAPPSSLKRRINHESAGQSIGGDASRILAEWPSDVVFTQEAALERRPELLNRRSVLVDLAYEEYCRIEERQGSVDRLEFAGRFPDIERSLLRVLDLHSFCRNESEIRRTFFGVPWPEPGDEILGFRLEEEIGRGAASRVFLATDPDLSERKVVVKIGKAHDEAAALGKLEHAGIVPVFSARIDPGTKLSVLCMPYWGRGTLLGLIDRLHSGGTPRRGRDLYDAAFAMSHDGADGEPAAIRQSDDRVVPRRFADSVAIMGAALADALAYAHAQGIVHSDVKPSNVLILPNGSPRLLDFNLARAGDADERHVGGTLPYMAPEQLQAWVDHNGRIGPAADVFSLGATLFELLTGDPPFGRINEPDIATSAATLADRHRRGPSPIPFEILKGNRQLGRWIERCLAADPQARPTASELAGGLAAIVPRRRWTLTVLPAALIAGLAVVTSAGLAAGVGRSTTVRIIEDGSALSDPEALALRGWQRLSNGDLDRAYADLKAAYTKDRSAENAAALGYCTMRLTGDWTTSARLFDEAVRAGANSPEVYNALGFCHFKRNRFEDAYSGFSEALERNSSFSAAQRNAILLELTIAREEKRHPDLQTTLKLLEGEDRGPLAYLDAACAYAQATAVGDDHAFEMVACCSTALERGIDPRELEIVVTFWQGANRLPEFRQLVQQRPHNSGRHDLLLERVPPPIPLLDSSDSLESSIAGR